MFLLMADNKIHSKEKNRRKLIIFGILEENDL